MMIQVIASEELYIGHPPPPFAPWHVNLAACSALRDVGSYTIRLPGGTDIRSPICELTLPQKTLFVSGVAEELLARAR